MRRFAVNRGYFENNGGGCHICLYLNDVTGKIGYLHLSGDNFYKISPNRELFLENFKSLNNYCVQT